MQLLSRLNPDQKDKVLTLVELATVFDGINPFAEHVLLHLEHGGDLADQHLVVEEGNQMIAYAHIDATDQVLGPSVEMAVEPSQRNRGTGKQVLETVIKEFGTNIRLWSHGELDSAKKLAESFGFEKVRTVIQMRRNLDNLPELPKVDFKVRTFLPGLDDFAWLELNRKVFKTHPEQGRWKEKDLSIRISEDWFDAAGFFLVEENQQIIAFCWTKIHSHSHIDNKHHQIGELYITGVDSEYEGKGLGKFLTILGMQHLARKGLHQVLLYTDLENDRAIRLYEKLGFAEISRDVMYKKA